MMMMNEAMEKNSQDVESDDQKFELPPGFRFHPTDEELITHYLSQKVLDTCFSSRAIGEADLNKCEPWDLPWKAKMGENEWYFFCMRDRKYPSGLRTNRATSAGYWKATGKDKEIYRGKILIGMKKTLVFYKGRAPKGEKTNWVMHEYRLEDNNSIHNHPKKTMNEWSICRVFEKGYCGKKIDIPLNSYGKELPPLMDDSPYNSETKTTIGETSHVTCFSDPNNLIEEQKTQQQYEEDIIVDSFETQKIIGTTSSYCSWNFSPASWNFSPQVGNSFSSDSFMVQEQSMLKMLIENNESSTKYKNQKAMENDFDVDNSSVIYNNEMFQRSFGNNHFSSASLGHVDNDFLWNF